MPAPSVIIKKYENRRLYDTSNSRYVNLDDIAQMVRDGADIRVIDAATGEDLTRLVLTQIIVETAKVPDSPFPTDMLREMIIASGRLSREGMRAYMNTIFDLYQNTYRAFTPDLPSFAGIRRADTESPSAKPNAASRSNATSAAIGGSEGSSVDDLRRRVEELERRLAKEARSRPAAKRARRPRTKE